MRNDGFYKSLLDKIPFGYAYHKLILDSSGVPCDYEFIEVNPAFEKFTGLKGNEITGRRLTEIIPV
jgi:PAS domain S-box-containing protein